MRKRDITEAERRSWDGPLPEQRVQCYWSDAYRERTIEVEGLWGGMVAYPATRSVFHREGRVEFAGLVNGAPGTFLARIWRLEVQ